MSPFTRGMLVGYAIGLSWSFLVLGLAYLVDGHTYREHLDQETTEMQAECWRHDEERGGPEVVRVPCGDSR